MAGFTQTFGGTVVYASDVSYRAVTLADDVTLSWPTELATNTNVVASIMDVTPTAGELTITMPPADEASVGETALFFNAGALAFTVADAAGNTIVSVATGIAWQVYLTGNSTEAGTWRATQYGAGTSSASAGSLVGAGIKAINTTLNQSMVVTSLSIDYTLGDADRSGAFIWTGGAGTLTLPSAATVGNDWFFQVRNSGTGAISIAATGGQLINGGATLAFNPGDSAIIVCDGSAFFTIGFGQSASFAFDFVSIDLTAETSPYTLAGANLNRIAYQFSGTITGNMQVVVPATIQQYWVSNETDLASDPYTIEVKTSSGTGITISRNARAILYCNGTDVIDADTSTVSFPISVAQGGTGATTASGARVNLGGTATGIALFTAADAAAGRTAISAAASGANSDITSLTGLTTPLSVVQGGSGQSTFTDGQLLIGNTSGNTLTKATLTAGANVTITNAGGSITIASTGGGGGGGGTVTSVDASGGTTGMSFTGGPVTTSGTLTLDGTLLIANGGTGATTAATARASLGAGTVSSVGGTGTVNGITLTGTVTSSGSLTLGGTLSGVNLTTQVTGTLPVASGGTNQTTFTNGQLLIGNTTGNTLTKATLTAGSGVSITNGAGSITISATGGSGTVTSVGGTGTVNGITLTGTVTTSGNLTLGGTLSGVSLTTQVTGTLPVANGGTGGTTQATARSGIGAAASGANTDITALDQDVTITATGTIAADTIGFRGIPQNAQTGAYTLVLADAGKHISNTTGGFAIPANGTTAFPIGTTIVVFNNSGTSQNITITTDTLRLAGTATTGTRALAQYGLATLVKVTSTVWVASGAGLT